MKFWLAIFRVSMNVLHSHNDWYHGTCKLKMLDPST